MLNGFMIYSVMSLAFRAKMITLSYFQMLAAMRLMDQNSL